MDLVAASLCLDHELRIGRAVDLLSAALEFRDSVAARMSVLGGEAGLNKGHLINLFRHDENSSSPVSHLALQAWAAWRAGTLPSMAQRLAKVPRIDTRAFCETRLRVLAKLAREARRLSDIKPTRVENEVDTENFSCKGGELNVMSTRFSTRVMASHNQRIEVESTTGAGKVSKFSGKTVFVEGRAAHIALSAAKFTGDTIRVTTVGREGPTRAESQRADIVRKVLQGTCTLLEQPFFQALWLAGSCVPRAEHDIELYFPSRELNRSQRAAVRAILSNDDLDRVTLVQGPPGTGKTTVIAAAVVSIVSSAHDLERTVWVVAQSNVAVKNIAEKLADVNCEFTLLVSKDFHYDWRHLYEKIMDNVIRSDDLTDNFEVMEERMLHSRVVLCTLSMLSNPRISAVTRLVPLQTLMVDEASQVEIGDFLPLLYLFAKSLQKMVFIGDDKQCKFSSSQLGSFIGKQVYDDKLKTVHRIKVPCCRFIDVKGAEVLKGRSWINVAEAQAAVVEARFYHKNRRSYRIITPYDAQRALLESTLKAAKIPWENKVFCVDSFQGNEDDYIILSTVRTERIGFLAEVRRGMVICTNRAFLEGAAKESLVGLLAAKMGDEAWD
ncbi:P-loop containing nucleoside triphosphate hydrolase protein [Mycena leptocephala]|nr:P-loop containing nucleoside triphosphate hydrolase protein [Mycena leptocephala]